MPGWWERPEVYHPLLFMVEDKAVGFAVVEAPPVSPDGVQYYLPMLFLHHAYRGGETPNQALRLVFDRFHGAWEINTVPGDQARHKMLHDCLSDYVPRKYKAGIGTGSMPAMGWMTFRFDNSQ